MPIRDEGAPIPLEHAFLERMAQSVGGSFYVFDEARFEGHYAGFRQRLRHHYANTEVAYAFKANYLPAIGAILARLDGMGEVVSRFEYEVARRSLPAERLIFNGPVKRREDLRMALAAGSMVNVDSFREIRTLEEIAGEFPTLEVGVRVTFPLAGSASSSRFGFQLETGELDTALDKLSRLENVKVTGLHCHFSARDKSLAGYVQRVSVLHSLADRLSHRYRIDTLNIGGGFFSPMPAALKAQFPMAVPSLDEYADAIGRAFGEGCPDRSRRLVVEPGTSMVADTLCLAAQVIEIRYRAGCRQALLDTSINSVNPTRSARAAPMRAITRRQVPCASSRRYRLVGHTCMEHDVIADDFVGWLEEGDFVVFDNRGAYSINHTPPFISPGPAIVTMRGRRVKRADDVSSVLSSYVVSPGETP